MLSNLGNQADGGGSDSHFQLILGHPCVCLTDGRADAVACVALVVAAVHPPAREGLGSGGGVFCGVPVRPLGDVKERG